MAQRRMFSKTITNSGKFLKMPPTSRLLYYDLGMNADDDGYTEWFTVVRMSGSTEQDLKVLEANGFVNIFDQNVLVILDWKEHNYIPKDRYTPSKYLNVYKLDTICIQNVDTGKDRLGKDNTESDSSLKLLDSPSEEIIKEMVSKFKVDKDQVVTKAHTLADYCRSKKKKYSNYKAVLSNALRKDFGERKFENRPILSIVDGVAKTTGYEMREV